jgi:hypothetical protein
MNVNEFRKNLKEQFDAALRGEEVMIERGSVRYQLLALAPKGYTGRLMKHRSGSGSSVVFDERVIDRERELMETPSVRQKTQENGICKNDGSPLDYRGRCLQKGCKYA